MDNLLKGRVIGVDWGAKRIGIAISDETCALARPLTVIQHTSRLNDAQRIIEMAAENQADTIITGIATTSEGELSPSGRSAQRLAAEIEKHSDLKVVLWDESFSTVDARESMVLSGKGRSKRHGHVDDKAAAILLQDFLNSQKNEA